jgi:hypothetical protein
MRDPSYHAERISLSRSLLFASASFALGCLTAWYFRFVLHDGTVWATDEGSYLEIITTLQSGLSFPVSGPLYILIVEGLQSVLGIQLVEALPIYAIFITCILPVTFYLLYLLAEKNLAISAIDPSWYALTCIVILFASSYFVSPLIEGRPQQLGSFLMMVTLYVYHQQLLLNSKKLLVPLMVFSIVVFYYHILSFIILISIAGMLWYWLYITDRTTVKNFIPGLFVSAFCGALFVQTDGVYFSMYQDLLNFHLQGINFYLAIALLAGMATLAFSLQKFVLQFASVIERSFSKKRYLIFFISVSVMLLIFQYYLLEHLVADFYRHSFPLFVTFQLCNIFFMVLYFFGLHFLHQENRLNNFFVIASILVLILGVVSLGLSFFLGHKNLLLRLLNYWVLFAAPIASVTVIRGYQFHKATIAILPVAIFLSVVLSSKSSYFFNFDAYWEKNDIEMVSEACRLQNNGDFSAMLNQNKSFANRPSHYIRLYKIICPKNDVRLIRSSIDGPVSRDT